jgi:hypothetical protein
MPEQASTKTGLNISGVRGTVKTPALHLLEYMYVVDNKGNI